MTVSVTQKETGWSGQRAWPITRRGAKRNNNKKKKSKIITSKNCCCFSSSSPMSPLSPPNKWGAEKQTHQQQFQKLTGRRAHLPSFSHRGCSQVNCTRGEQMAKMTISTWWAFAPQNHSTSTLMLSEPTSSNFSATVLDNKREVSKGDHGVDSRTSLSVQPEVPWSSGLHSVN